MAIINKTPIPVRFSRHWSLDPKTGCHEWFGAKDSKGYGQLRCDGKNRIATHIALDIAGFKRPSPESCALHKCDNPACVNPDHLWWGTRKENTRDAMAKGRLNVDGLKIGHQLSHEIGKASRILCDECGIEYKSKPVRIAKNKRNFCSQLCSQAWQKRNFIGRPRSEF